MRHPVSGTPMRHPVIETQIRHLVTGTPMRHPVIETQIRHLVTGTPMRHPVIETQIRHLVTESPMANPVIETPMANIVTETPMRHYDSKKALPSTNTPAGSASIGKGTFAGSQNEPVYSAKSYKEKEDMHHYTQSSQDRSRSHKKTDNVSNNPFKEARASKH